MSKRSSSDGEDQLSVVNLHIEAAAAEPDEQTERFDKCLRKYSAFTGTQLLAEAQILINHPQGDRLHAFTEACRRSQEDELTAQARSVAGLSASQSHGEAAATDEVQSISKTLFDIFRSKQAAQEQAKELMVSLTEDYLLGGLSALQAVSDADGDAILSYRRALQAALNTAKGSLAMLTDRENLERGVAPAEKTLLERARPVLEGFMGRAFILIKDAIAGILPPPPTYSNRSKLRSTAAVNMTTAQNAADFNISMGFLAIFNDYIFCPIADSRFPRKHADVLRGLIIHLHTCPGRMNKSVDRRDSKVNLYLYLLFQLSKRKNGQMPQQENSMTRLLSCLRKIANLEKDAREPYILDLKENLFSLPPDIGNRVPLGSMETAL